MGYSYTGGTGVQAVNPALEKTTDSLCVQLHLDALKPHNKESVGKVMPAMHKALLALTRALRLWRLPPAQRSSFYR